MKRTPEEVAFDLVGIIARCGPTKRCPLCKMTKGRGDFSSFKIPGYSAQSTSRCKKCLHKLAAVCRKKMVRDKKSKRYQHFAKLKAGQQNAYKERLRARLNAVDAAARANPLASKLNG